jgi:hypothetical protein
MPDFMKKILKGAIVPWMFMLFFLPALLIGGDEKFDELWYNYWNG